MAKLFKTLGAGIACIYLNACSGSEHVISPSTDVKASPARDGNIAITEEFNAARQKNTAAAYTLFIERHPDHTLANQAREKLQHLKE